MNLFDGVITDLGRGLLGKPRVGFLLACLGYAVLVHFTYLELVASSYEYFGFGAAHVPVVWTAAGYLCAILPSLWLPLRLTRGSDLVYLILYFLVYVPPMLICDYVVWPALTYETVFSMRILLLLGMSLIQLFRAASPLPVKLRPVKEATAVWSLVIFGVGSTLYLLIQMSGRLHFTLDFNEIYEIRGELAEMDLGFTSYLVPWMASLVLPLTYALGLLKRKRWLQILALGGPLLLYSTLPNKAFLFSPVYFLGIYVFIRLFPRTFSLAMASGLGVLVSLGLLEKVTGPSPITSMVTAVVNFRLLSIPSQLFNLYMDFFQSHPTTGYSHVNAISKFIHYPYSISVGQVVGDHYFGSISLNANACFWLTDGIAALGRPGILVASILFGLVLRLFDTVSRDMAPEMAALISCFAVVNMMATSLFTSLLTGGFGILILSLLFFPREWKDAPMNLEARRTGR